MAVSFIGPINPYKGLNTGNLLYKGAATRFGFVSFELVGANGALTKEGLLAKVNQLGADAEKIVKEELRSFGQNVAQPIYAANAPFKESGGFVADSSYGKPYTWFPHPHLKDSIKAELRGAYLALSMMQRGIYVVQGRKGFRTRPGTVLKIEEPGGTIAFRTSVRPISAQVLQWPQKAYKQIEQLGLFENLAQRIAARLIREIEIPLRSDAAGSSFAEEFIAGRAVPLPQAPTSHRALPHRERRIALHKTRLERYYQQGAYHHKMYKATGSEHHKHAYYKARTKYRHEQSRFGRTGF